MPKSTPRYKPHLIEMERCLIEGASTLLRAKHTYWPIEGSTEPHEANLVLHAAAAFTRAGHHAYAEVHPADAPNEQIDLVVIGTSDGTHWALAAEAKRLHSTEKARSLGEDTRRLRHTRLPNAEEELGSFVYVSCVLASCWSPDTKRWWEGYERAASPKGTHHSSRRAWEPLKHYLDDADRACAIDIRDDEPHWMLYALKEHERS